MLQAQRNLPGDIPLPDFVVYNALQGKGGKLQGVSLNSEMSRRSQYYRSHEQVIVNTCGNGGDEKGHTSMMN